MTFAASNKILTFLRYRIICPYIYLTYQMAKSKDSERDRLDAEISDEITPEMLAAGGAVVEAWDYGYPSSQSSTHRQLAAEVYLAMKRCEPRKTRP